MAFCNQCGAQIPEGAPFCSNCGAAQGSGGKSRKGLIIGLSFGGVALVAGLVVLILFLTGVLGDGNTVAQGSTDATADTNSAASTATTETPVAEETKVIDYPYYRVTLPSEWEEHIKEPVTDLSPHGPWYDSLIINAKDTTAGALVIECVANGFTSRPGPGKDRELLGLLTLSTGFNMYLIADTQYLRGTEDGDWIYEHRQELFDGIEAANGCTLDRNVVYNDSPGRDYNDVIGKWVSREKSSVSLIIDPYGYYFFQDEEMELTLSEGYLVSQRNGNLDYRMYRLSGDGGIDEQAEITLRRILTENVLEVTEGGVTTEYVLADVRDSDFHLYGSWISPSSAGYVFYDDGSGYYRDENEDLVFEFYWRDLLGLPPEAVYGVELYQNNNPLGDLYFYLSPSGFYYTEVDGTIYERGIDDTSDTVEAPANYEEVLARFASALGGEEVSLGIGHDDPLNYGASCIIMELAHGQYAGGTDGPVGYVLKDLDGDGTPELLIGRNSKVYPMKDGAMEGKDAAEIIAIYTIEGNRSVPVMFGWTRSCYYFREDNTLIHFGSMGAGESYGSNWQYKKGSISQYGYGISCHGGSYYALPENGDFSDLSMPIDDATYIDWHDSYLTNVVTLPFQALP